ncbi:MAG: ribosome maturation factor RimP [Gammaproteobacteria bacterium]|nr:ribosome maturation factor RimP [Gammaproteobacteria bacterium]
MRQRLFALLEPVVTGLGYELVELEFSPAGQRALVRVYIDRTDGGAVRIEDCERASHALGETLDAADPIGRAYQLEVSSPGFDRPLRTAAHFARFAGSEARIELGAPQDGRRRFRGRLLGVEDGQVRIHVDQRDWSLPIAGISKARLVG